MRPNLLGGITLRPERVDVTGISEFGFGTDSLAFSTAPGTCPGGFTRLESEAHLLEALSILLVMNKLSSVSPYCSVAVGFSEVRPWVRSLANNYSILSAIGTYTWRSPGKRSLSSLAACRWLYCTACLLLIFSSVSRRLANSGH